MMFVRHWPKGLSVGAAVFIAAMGTSGQALACSNTTEVMAHFEKVKNAYLAKAPTMAPEKFQVWTGYLQQFGNAMGKADYTGACGLLDKASVELGFDVAAAAAPAVPAAAPAASAPAANAPAAEAPAASAPAANAPAPAQPAPAKPAAGGASGWIECPRGRCWGRDQGLLTGN